LNSRLAKIARIAAKITGGLIAFVALIVLACFILNSIDAPLSPQAQTLLTPPRNPYASDENIYLAMAGLEGAGERPIIEMGQERIEAYNQAFDSIPASPDTASKLNRKWDAAKLAFTGKLELGPQRTTSIWTDVKSHRQDIAALLASNEKLYKRYLSLHDLHGYYETARPSYLAPLIFAPQPLRILFLADVANRLQSGTLQQQRDALNELQQDLQMWKLVLLGDGTLLSKMVATASLHGDLILAADLIADPNIDLSSLDDLLTPTLVPFDLKDYRIGKAFPAEFRGTAVLLKTLQSNSSATPPSNLYNRASNAFQAHFLKLNSTENISAARAAHWAVLVDSDPTRLNRNLEANRDWLKHSELRLSPGILYNPIGKILVAIATPQIDAYPLRVYDVAAYHRLVYLVLELKHQHIATSDVASFLLKHPEWSTHPVDGRPFRWSAETGELAVNTLSEHPKDQRFSVMYFTAARDRQS
jgi:hypothetical protein